MHGQFITYMGIDITFGPKPVTFVALDEDQQPLAIGEGEVADALAFAAGQTAGALIAVNAAAHPNHGRMKRAEVRQSLIPPPPKGKYTALRQAEYELAQAGLRVPETPDAPEKSLPWVRKGFLVAEKLEWLGYRPFPDTTETPSQRQWLEINATAAFWSLLGVEPLESGTLEGRIQRQLVLKDEGLKVPDAMDFFEEITRFKILKSSLPDKDIFSQAELNAWIGAYTAWLAHKAPERVRRYGESEEGFIYLPVRS